MPGNLLIISRDPDWPFYNFGAAESVARRSWTTWVLLISWFWGYKIEKEPVGMLMCMAGEKNEQPLELGNPSKQTRCFGSAAPTNRLSESREGISCQRRKFSYRRKPKALFFSGLSQLWRKLYAHTSTSTAIPTWSSFGGGCEWHLDDHIFWPIFTHEGIPGGWTGRSQTERRNKHTDRQTMSNMKHFYELDERVGKSAGR